MDYIKNYDGTLYGSYRTKKFGDVWSTANDFLVDYLGNGVPTTIPSDVENGSDQGSVYNLYFLLYSRYGNDVIASSDLQRFKMRLFTIIWQYGPNWAKNLEIQSKLRKLTDDEITQGSVQIYNQADNPSTDPSTDTSEYLKYIKAQNTSINKKGKLEGYALLDSLLKRDVTQEFLNRFKPLFKTVVEPEELLLYEDYQ